MAASKIVVEKGVGNVTLDNVSREAGVSKGGLTYYFPSRKSLVESLFQKMLKVFEKHLDRAITADQEKRGVFTRAYVSTITSPAGKSFERKLLGKVALVMSVETPLVIMWHEWLERQLLRFPEEGMSINAKMIRYAADGIWLEACLLPDLSQPRKNTELIDQLIKLSRYI